jgi:hypothetical protein
LFKTPKINKAPQTWGAVGILRPVTRTNPHNASAATVTRMATIVMTGSSATKIALNKNDPPQTVASVINITQSKASIFINFANLFHVGITSVLRRCISKFQQDLTKQSRLASFPIPILRITHEVYVYCNFSMTNCLMA